MNGVLRHVYIYTGHVVRGLSLFDDIVSNGKYLYNKNIEKLKWKKKTRNEYCFYHQNVYSNIIIYEKDLFNLGNRKCYMCTLPQVTLVHNLKNQKCS